MSETNKPIDSWGTLLVSFTRLHQKMAEEMKTLGHPDLETYDVLWVLEQAPRQALRFNTLGEKVFLSRYGVTRLAERLVKQGLIERFECPKDKRGVYAHITEKGLKLRKEMWKSYSKMIQNYYSKHLTEKEHQQIITTLKKVYQEPEYPTTDCDD